MNYLYFADAANNAQVYPATALLGAAQTAATTVAVYLAPLTNDASDRDVQTLTVTSGTGKEVIESIVRAANQPVNQTGGFVVVADDVNSIYVNADITAVSDLIDA